LGSNPTDKELAIAIKSLQSIYNKIGIKGSRKELYAQGIEKLKTKTLLLDKALLAPGITEKTVKTVYPHPFQIVDNATIEKAVMNTEPEFAVVNIIPVMGLAMLMQSVTSTDGELLSADSPSVTAKAANPMKITKVSLAQYLTVH
jgi:hypothetical protein